MKVICNQQRIQNKYLWVLTILNLVVLLSGSLYQVWLGLMAGFLLSLILNLWILKKYKKRLKNAKDFVTINMGAFHHHYGDRYYELPLFDIEDFVVKPHHKNKRGLRNIKVIYNRNQAYEFEIDFCQLEYLEKVIRRPLNYELIKQTHPQIPHIKQKKAKHYPLLQILLSLVGLVLSAVGIYLYEHGMSDLINRMMLMLIITFALGHFYSFLDKQEKWYIKLSYMLIGVITYVFVIVVFISIYSRFFLDIPFSFDYFIYGLYAISSFTVVILFLIHQLSKVSYA